MPVTTGVGMRHVALSVDGTRLAYSQGGQVGNVWRIPILEDRTATWADAEQITYDTAWIEAIGLSPDGQQLAVASDRAGNLDIWVFPTAGGELRRVTTDSLPDWAPKWSPDGTQLAFHSYRSGNREIWVVPVSGGTATQLTSMESVVWWSTWSPDGESIAFGVSRSGSGAGIWTVPAEGGEPRRITSTAGDNRPSWSPDGNWIAFTGTGGLSVVRPSGEGRRALGPGGGPVGWSADGTTTYATRRTDGMRQLWSIAIDGGSSRQLTALSGRRGQMGQYNHETDGRYVYFTWNEDVGDIWVMDVVQDEE